MNREVDIDLQVRDVTPEMTEEESVEAATYIVESIQKLFPKDETAQAVIIGQAFDLVNT